MKYSLDHNIEPSAYLWLDYVLVEQNEAFANYSGALRSSTQLVSGLNSYSAPHRQFVYDSSVSGAFVPSGVSIGGTFAPTGASVKIDYYRGQALLTGSPASVTARYSYKEFNIYFTDSSEKQILFENKFVLAPRSQPKNENFDAKDLSYPCIFIKSSAGDNKMECFEGCGRTTIPVRLIILAENFFQYRAVTSALRDKKDKWMPIFNPNELPFDEYYSLKNGPFDYSESVKSIQTDAGRLAYISDVSVSDFQDKVNSLIGPRVFGGFIDLDLELFRCP